MAGFAPLQRKQAPPPAVAQAHRGTGGPLAQLAGALNTRPAVAQLHALSDGMSKHAPVQRVFAIKGGKEYDDGDEVKKNTTLANRLKDDGRKDEIIDQVAKMAEDVNDYGTLSWVEVINEAKKALGDDNELMDFSSILDDTNEMADEKEVRKLNRSNSMDFSDLIKNEFGKSTQEARESTMRIEFESGLKNFGKQEFTTSGGGRQMSIAKKQISKDTKYRKFIPTLKTKIGKDEKTTATLLLLALTNDDEYRKLAASEGIPELGQLALEQTVALFHNEIISRSSSNLPTIIGVLQSVSQGKTASMLKGFEKVGMFVPTGSDHSYGIGGQMLSRVHHKNSEGRRLYKDDKYDNTLKRLYEDYHGGLLMLSKKHKTDIPGLTKPIHKLHRHYLKNLKRRTKVSFPAKKIVKKKK